MGLYVINCSICHEPFLWFSGNLPDQSCSKCKGVHMTHASNELKRLQDGFDKWAYDASGTYECENQFSERKFDESGYKFRDFDAGAKQAAKLFFPFVAHVLNDPIHSAEKTALLNRFKHALGMELIGVE